MKILVTNLPGVQVDDQGNIRHFAKAGSRWPMTIGQTKSVDYYAFPFWLAYTTALLKRDTNHQIQGLDGVVTDCDQQEYFEKVERFSPNVIIVELTTISIDQDIQNLSSMKEAFNCVIIATGNYPTAKHKAILREYPCIDYCIRGEYEYVALDLVHVLDGKKNVQEIQGISYRSDDGSVKINPDRPLSKTDYANLPWPDREDFPATLYPDFAIYAPCVTMTASRGCPAKCVFCQERHIMYNSGAYRIRAPKDVVDEMVYIRDHFQARQIYFDDMTLVVNNDYTQAVCEEIIKQKLGIPWTCMGDVMFVKPETLRLMAKAGCIGMKFGVESADADILKTIGKPLNIKKAKEMVALCKDLGIRTHATYMIGLPGETEETIQKTYDCMLELNTFTSQIAKAVPYPGTPFYQWATEGNYLNVDQLSDLDGMGKSVMEYPELSGERMDSWYEKFSKTIARQKLKNFIGNPQSSFSILKEFVRHKGMKKTFDSIYTVVERTV